MGRIVSVNVAKPTTVRWKGRSVRTGFFKRAREGTVHVGALNLDGDAQADLRVHGGPAMAVYVYPSEHYVAWAAKLSVLEVPWGSFGENLTIEGHLESDVRPGDVFHAGTARLQVTKPREPCYKLNLRFRRDDVVKMFAQQDRPGFYCRVLQEGEVRAGDAFERATAATQGPTLVELFRQRVRRG